MNNTIFPSLFMALLLHFVLKLAMHYLLFSLGMLNYFPIICGAVGVLHVISFSFILGKKIPSILILVCVAVAPTILTTTLHILEVAYSLDIVTSVTLLLGSLLTMLKLPR